MKNHRASCIKNTRGFSLVELIIVVAIMVALIAVLAPNYVKYIDRARDAVVTDAAETVAQFCKTEFASGTFTGSGTLRVGKNESGRLGLTIKEDNGFNYNGKTGAECLSEFSAACGFDGSKQVKTDLAYLIEINGTVFSKPEIEIFEESTVEN